MRLLRGRQKVLDDFKSKLFPNGKQTQGKEHPAMLASDLARVAKISDYIHLRILIPKQMLQRFLIAHTQAKSGNTSGNLLNEICQIISLLYRAKEIY